MAFNQLITELYQAYPLVKPIIALVLGGAYLYVSYLEHKDNKNKES